MADEILKRDQNSAVVLGGITDDVNQNIKMLRVNPVTGRLLISGTGLGIVELSSTEVPNGSITVFTFSSASAQPSYIVSDNVWMKATTKSGTVNWTWNGGLKQATLSVPPSDEIYAIV